MYDEQRKLHDLNRLEKDKQMTIEMQCKSLRMEYEMLEKEKNNEINRITRQL